MHIRAWEGWRGPRGDGRGTQRAPGSCQEETAALRGRAGPHALSCACNRKASVSVRAAEFAADSDRRRSLVNSASFARMDRFSQFLTDMNGEQSSASIRARVSQHMRSSESECFAARVQTKPF
eukprot:5505670-Pleurochrysis_carterae.AAC.3